MKKKTAQAAAVASTALLALGTAPASQAAEQGAQKFHFYAMVSPPECDGRGGSGSVTGIATAIINEANGRVSATVHIKGGTPNTRYVIRLIQEFGDCLTVDETVRTNKRGIATVHMSEPVRRGSVSALLVLDTRRLFGDPEHYTEPYYY
jgi:uncharacterized membrane protein